MSGYKTAHLDDIAAEQWPYWAPIRHHFDIGAFGINAWRAKDGDEVIKGHNESESGQEELFLVLSGSCTFTVDGDEIPAPAGTIVYVSDAGVERVAVAREDGTVVLSIGGTRGTLFEPSGWDSHYLEGA
jgi:uncharacterized cupin superfamily protein